MRNICFSATAMGMAVVLFLTSKNSRGTANPPPAPGPPRVTKMVRIRNPGPKIPDSGGPARPRQPRPELRQMAPYTPTRSWDTVWVRLGGPHTAQIASLGLGRKCRFWPGRGRGRGPGPGARVSEFDAPGAPLIPGDLGTWDLPDASVDEDGLVHTPACDDLAALSAALEALDELASADHVRLLLTRAEEVGFVGATAACRPPR